LRERQRRCDLLGRGGRTVDGHPRFRRQGQGASAESRYRGSRWPRTAARWLRQRRRVTRTHQRIRSSLNPAIQLTPLARYTATTSVSKAEFRGGFRHPRETAVESSSSRTQVLKLRQPDSQLVALIPPGPASRKLDNLFDQPVVNRRAVNFIAQVSFRRLFPGAQQFGQLRERCKLWQTQVQPCPGRYRTAV
jgi:hypothetical protein